MKKAMTAASAFTQLLKALEPFLKRSGFVRSKSTFWIQRNSNIGIINVQKSAKSSAEGVVFTFNVGVWSDRIARFRSGDLKSRPPAVDDCHWRERIGFLLPGREDKWWVIREGDAPTLSDQLAPVITQVAIPAIFGRLADEALRDEWLVERSPGLTDIQRLMYLTILLKDIGPHDAFANVIAELKRKSVGEAIEATVARHVQKLELHDRPTVAW